MSAEAASKDPRTAWKKRLQQTCEQYATARQWHHSLVTEDWGGSLIAYASLDCCFISTVSIDSIVHPKSSLVILRDSIWVSFFRATMLLKWGLSQSAKLRTSRWCRKRRVAEIKLVKKDKVLEWYDVANTQEPGYLFNTGQYNAYHVLHLTQVCADAIYAASGCDCHRLPDRREGEETRRIWVNKETKRDDKASFRLPGPYIQFSLPKNGLATLRCGLKSESVSGGDGGGEQKWSLQSDMSTPSLRCYFIPNLGRY